MSISEGEGVFMEKADLTMLKKATRLKIGSMRISSFWLNIE